jgi:methanogenic corrinoid protein MtbC1
MEKVVQALQNEGIRGKVKIIIGGAPVGADFDHRIGANAHGAAATEIVTLARILMNQPGIRAQINQRLWEISEKNARMVL